jgi:hypothetical protein
VVVVLVLVIVVLVVVVLVLVMLVVVVVVFVMIVMVVVLLMLNGTVLTLSYCLMACVGTTLLICIPKSTFCHLQNFGYYYHAYC